MSDIADKKLEASADPDNANEIGRGILGTLKNMMPKSLFGRSIIIIVAPMVLLQSVLTFVFLERHWQLVTQRMSEAVAREMSALVQVLEAYPQDTENEVFNRIASDSLGMRVDVLPHGALPPPSVKPFFNLLDRTLAREISTAVKKPFWINTVGNSNLIEVRFLLDEKILRIITRRSQAYATNSHIFLVWMVGTSFVLILISVIFLKNQIRPIQRLAKAAERFGRGHSISNISHAGAREVRQASQSLVEMSERIERQIDQRAIMLAGVSHDLRTILTRFRLQLAMIDASDDRAALIEDVDDMEQMLHDYMSFASGTAQEADQRVDLKPMLASFCEHAELQGVPCSFSLEGDSNIEVRPNAFKRCIGNLVSNACRYGQTVKITAYNSAAELVVTVEDDGPGIPENARDDVFKPFFRLDEARNQDQSGTGLGLAIAKDIALVHGGDIILGDSTMGGLKAELKLPNVKA